MDKLQKTQIERVTEYVDRADEAQTANKLQRIQTEQVTKYAGKADKAQIVDEP